MSLQADVLTEAQQPQILHEPADVHSLVDANEAIELGEAYGPKLDEAQKITLRTWMGTRKDGTWAAFQAGHAMSRQNGKGDELQVRELFGLTQLGESIIHTAHEVATSKNAFLRLEATLLNYDDLRKLVKGRPRHQNGDEAIFFRSGAEIRYKSRTGGSARGFDDISLVVYDEAQHLKAEHLAASSPTLAVNPNSQMILTGSAGLSFSEPWWEMRLAALRGAGGRLGYVEHTAERIWFDEAGRLTSVRPDPDDPHTWAMANPAYGRRITDEFFAAQRLVLGPELFLREHCGVWDQLPSMLAQQGAKIPEIPWQESVTAAFPKVIPGELFMAYDVEIDGSHSGVSIATGDLSDGYVQTIEHRPGVGWLPKRLVELARTWRPPKILLDGASGAAAAALGEIREEFERAGLDPNVLEPMTSSAYKAACASFLQAVVDGKVHRPEVENDRLHMAGMTARERAIGDAWVFDRRNSPEPIVALTSAAMARSALSEPVEIPKVFAF